MAQFGVTCNTRGPGFESSHWQFSMTINFTVEKTKIQEKVVTIGPFKTKYISSKNKVSTLEKKSI